MVRTSADNRKVRLENHTLGTGHVRTDKLDFILLNGMVMIAIRPHKKDAVHGTRWHLFFDLRLIQRRPVMGAASDPAGRSNRATDAVFQYPQCSDRRLVIPIRVVGV